MRKNNLKSLESAIKFWWTGLFVGFLAVFLGCWSVSTPLQTLVALNIIFIASFFVGGIADLFYGLAMRKETNDWLLLIISGIINVVIGFLLLSARVDSFVVLLLYVGFWILFHSLNVVLMAFRLKGFQVRGWASLAIFGVIGVVLSFFMIGNFAFATGFITTLFSLSLIVYGITRVFHACALRRLKKLM